MCVPIYFVGDHARPGFIFCVVHSHDNCGPCCLEANIEVICNKVSMDEEARGCGWCDCGCWLCAPCCVRFKNKSPGVFVAVFIQLDVKRFFFTCSESLVALYKHSSEVGL